MNIQTVAENLRNTIAGKEQMLAQYQSALACSYAGPTPPVGAEMACIATIQFLEINITELKRILQDVEQCVAKDVEQSWRDNPDRMGGQFTQDELNESGWK
jgi:hypothetical protein